jgi:hypothetical protein
MFMHYLGVIGGLGGANLVFHAADTASQLWNLKNLIKAQG